MQIEKPHSLDKLEARDRLKALLDYWKREYGIRDTWNGDDQAQVSGRIMGFAFEAGLTLEDDRILVEGPSPNILVRGKVVSYIEGKLDQYLDPANSLDDLRA